MKSPWNFGTPKATGPYFVSVPSQVRGDKSRLFFVAIWMGNQWTGLLPAWADAITQWMEIPEPMAEPNLNAMNPHDN